MAARRKAAGGVSKALSALQDAMRGEVSSSDAEALLKFAIDVINQDYWDDVRGITGNLLAEVKAGQITDDEQLREALHQAIDSSSRVIYTFQARLGMLATNNADAWEDLGFESPTIEQQMFAALEADVRALLDAEDVESLMRGGGEDEED
jgi:hypothetical protein